MRTARAAISAVLARTLDQRGRAEEHLQHPRHQFVARPEPIQETYLLDPLCNAVAAATRAGIVVVVAAGNLGRNGYGSVLSPGNSPFAITVGAMKTMATFPRTDDLIATYSSKGPTYIDQFVQARCGGAGQPGRIAARPREHSRWHLSGQCRRLPATIALPAWARQHTSVLRRDQHGERRCVKAPRPR